jgi:hypothetical protein
MTKMWLTAVISCLLFSCGPGGNVENNIPAPGTIVAADSVKIVEDSLNKMTFSVKVVADSAVAKGVYNVDVAYGPNIAHGSFTMPKGGEHLAPALRKGKGNTYIIGFRQKQDTTFHGYVEVSCASNVTRIQYLYHYSFE